MIAAALARLAARQVRRGGLIVVALAAGTPAVVVATYDDLMARSAAAASLTALAGNPAIRTLFGEPLALDSAGGFTVWRLGTPLAVLAGAWAILVTTRITRGEEDAGRWQLLLAGRAPLRTVVATHLLVVACVPALMAASVFAAMTATGAGGAGAAVHAAGVGLTGLFFAAVAALAGQVFAARAPATAAAAGLLCAALLARMVGDGVAALQWVRWVTPFGLLELSRPYAGDRLGPLTLLLAATIATAALAMVLAGRRDVGAGLLNPRTRRAARPWLLGSPSAFALRRLVRPLAGWSAATVAYFLLVGSVTRTALRFLTDNPVFADAAGDAGFARLTSVAGLAATLFAVLGVPVGVFAADRIGAFAAAEADRRLVPLAAQPVTRGRLLGADAAVAVAGAVVLTTLAGAAFAAGVAFTGGGLSLPAAVAGSWNVLPVVLLSAGAAVLAVGWLPRLTGIVGAAPAAGGFLLLVVGQSAGAPRWVLDVSPYAHLAAVPLEPPAWPAAAAMTAVAALLAAAGIAGFERRDLRA